MARTDKRNAATGSGNGSLDVIGLTAVTAIVLGYAWSERSERHLTAENGLGYAFGIVGAVLMLIMLVYPLRKRISRLRGLGSVPMWFRIHIMFGILGPAFIILHSNFTLGSLNSRAAFFSMLVVAGSGYVGRFFYLRIHRGLGGQKRKVSEFTRSAAEGASMLGEAGLDPTVLSDYQERRLPARAAIGRVLLNFLSGPFSRARLRRQVISAMRGGGRDIRNPTVSLDRYLAAIARAEALLLYDRLFSLWHILHLPLFVILFFAAILHVVASHLY